MKKTKLFVVLMMMFAMLFAFDNTAKAAEEGFDIAFTAVGEWREGMESTIKVDITNNYSDVTFPAECLEVDLYDNGNGNVYVPVESASASLLSNDGYGLCFTNTEELAPGEVFSFEAKITWASDYTLRDKVWVDIYEQIDENPWLIEDAFWPELVEVTTDFSLEEAMELKRGEKFTGTITVKNISDFDIVDANFYMDAYTSAVQDDYEKLMDKMQFTYDWENVTLAPDEEKELTFSFVVPTDVVAGKIWIDFYLETYEEWYDEEADEMYSWGIQLFGDGIEVFVDGGTLNPFKDVTTNDWFAKYALYVYESGIMTGMNETTFGPTVELSRAQFATILYRMDGEADVSELDNPFPDVPAGQFYTNAAIWAADAGVITGYNNGNFGPNDMITREQMATILLRYIIEYGWGEGYVGDESVLSSFPDAASVSSFAKDGIIWAIDSGIITGDGGKINPQGTANRAQCATIVSRFWGME